MYISTTGVPVQLYLDGVDYIFDSHPDICIFFFLLPFLNVHNVCLLLLFCIISFDNDEDVMDYGLYLPNYYDKSAFDIPAICQNAQESKTGNYNKLLLLFFCYFVLILS